MQTDQIPQLLYRIPPAADLFPEALENLLGLVAEKLDQNIVFILEVEVDGPIGHSGFFGDFGNRRMSVSILGKYLDGGIENQMILVIFVFSVDRSPPWWPNK
jgi:hypothetical protein